VEKRQRRKLAVILHADVVSSTTLVQRDETLAHDRIQDSFRRFSETIKRYGGLTHELRGDALVAEFDRASDAVCAALAFQSGNAQFNAGLNDDLCPELRIGISMGEVVIADHTVTGAGVVLAQRLEQLAKPGGVCIQGAAYETVPQRLPFTYKSLGERVVKGFDAPVRAYAVSLTPGQVIPSPEGRAARKGKWLTVAVVGVVIAVAGGLTWFQPWVVREEPASVERMAHPLPDKPSIAVLPFTNMSGNPEQEYFSDGISEDIITDLSQISGLGVIARNSSFRYKDMSVNVQEIANELGVSHILEGSVRKVGDRVRITAQLLETRTGQHLWADRYDRQLIDIFELQDEIRLKIVSALSLRLVGDEEAHLTRRVTSSFEAYDLFLKARSFYNRYTNEDLDQAKDLYRQALELDPEFARAYGAMGVALARQVQFMETTLIDERLEQALEVARKAVAIEPASPQVQWALGYVYMFQGVLDEAAKAIEKSIALSPNYADGYAMLALINNNLGRGDQALRFINKAKKLNPKYTWEYPWNEGKAYYTIGEYKMAIDQFLETLERNEFALLPRLYLAASYLRIGQAEDAEWEITQAQVMSPNLSITHLERLQPLANGDHRDRFFEDMRKVGLPE
jgi:adenylate cyclase